jgi:hypothetical protein
MMKFSLVLGLVGLLCACAGVSPQSEPLSKERNPSNVGSESEGLGPQTSMRLADTKSKMIASFEHSYGRVLTQDERDAVVSFSTTTAMAGNSLYTQTASNSGDSDVTTVMLCLGAKGAIFIKIGGNVCIDTSGQAYILGISGMGISVGAAATGTVLIHKGPPGTIKGDYGGLTAGGAAAQFVSVGLRGILKTLGGEVAYMTHQHNGSVVVIGGVSIGPMIDFSMTGMTIK